MRLKVLMVSTEYPPIPGGVGRYTKNLVDGLKRIGVDIYVLCNDKGNGDFFSLDPANSNNSDVILNAINKSNSDVVHIQLEHGLYGLKQIYSRGSNVSVTNIDDFYEKCQIPIITTYHSAYPFQQWMRLSKLLYNQDNQLNKNPANAFEKIKEYWMRFMSFYSFSRSNRIKINKSTFNIAFSNYLAKLISGNSGDYNDEVDNRKLENKFSVIYHGAEPNLSTPMEKTDARIRFHLPLGKKIALFYGFATHTKGWDILNGLNVPNNWTIVINQSKNLFGTVKPPAIEILEKQNHKTKNSITRDQRIINLDKGFLTDTDLSILLYACDVVILPYTVTSGSGVMFDALAHGLPFIASDLGFFKEFEKKGLGIIVKRNHGEFYRALKKLELNYSVYAQRVEDFKSKLKWDNVARQHLEIYRKSLLDKREDNT